MLTDSANKDKKNEENEIYGGEEENAVFNIFQLVMMILLVIVVLCNIGFILYRLIGLIF